MPPAILGADQSEHGAPLAFDKEPALHPDASDPSIDEPEDEEHQHAQNLDRKPRYADLDGPAPPPPPHPRHAINARTRKIMSKAGTQASLVEDTPSWSTFDIHELGL